MTTTTERYQGWANYETWAVKLWMDNDQGPYPAPLAASGARPAPYLYWSGRARELLQDPGALTYANEYMTEYRRRVNQLADELQEAHEAELPDVQGFAADLLNSAFGAVDWHEIAESLLDDAATS